MGTSLTRPTGFLRTEGVALLALGVLFYALHRAGACFHLAGTRSQPVDFRAPDRKPNGSCVLQPCVYSHSARDIRCISWTLPARIAWPDMDGTHRLRPDDGAQFRVPDLV